MIIRKLHFEGLSLSGMLCPVGY